MRASIGPQILDGAGTLIAEVFKIRTISMYNGTGSTIPAGSCVQPDLTIATSVVPLGSACKLSLATAANARLIVGAAAAAIPTGQWGEIQVAGYQTGVNVVNATAAETLLIGSVTTAGRLIAAAFAAGERPVAYSLTAAGAGNTADVIWMNHFA